MDVRNVVVMARFERADFPPGPLSKNQMEQEHSYERNRTMTKKEITMTVPQPQRPLKAHNTQHTRMTNEL